MRYYMFNKPRGVITACSDPRHETVMKYFPESEREGLFPVGRLDKDTEGFLIMTDDGALCHKINTPSMKKEKTYVFYARGAVSDEDIGRLLRGVDIGTGTVAMAKAERAEIIGRCELLDIAALMGENEARMKVSRKRHDPVTKIRMTITEGKKHQVKRMSGAIGAPLIYLERVSISGIPLDPSLGRGEYRPMSESEIAALLS